MYHVYQYIALFTRVKTKKEMNQILVVRYSVPLMSKSSFSVFVLNVTDGTLIYNYTLVVQFRYGPLLKKKKNNYRPICVLNF